MWAFFVCLKSGRSFTFIRSCCAISCYIYLGISRYRQFAIPPPPKNKTTTTTTKQTTKSTKKRKQTKKHTDQSVEWVRIILKVYSMGHYWVTTYSIFFILTGKLELKCLKFDICNGLLYRQLKWVHGSMWLFHEHVNAEVSNKEGYLVSELYFMFFNTCSYIYIWLIYLYMTVAIIPCL